MGLMNPGELDIKDLCTRDLPEKREKANQSGFLDMTDVAMPSSQPVIRLLSLHRAHEALQHPGTTSTPFRGASILRTLELLAVLFPEASTLQLLGQSSRHTENNKFYDVLEEHKCGGAGKEAVGETAALQLFVATSQGHRNWRSVCFP